MKDLQRTLTARIRKYNIPGASMAVMKGGRVVAEAAAGLTNLDTKVPVTTDTLFQIGSITKIFTTTQIMQLVDEGLLDLDEPVRTYLPEFRVDRADISNQVTIRQFLCHVSGIDGDFFEDTGSGDDAIARLIERARLLPSLYEPGEMMSYCNFGFAVLGRIIEKKRGKSWDDALKQDIFDPLGMTQAISKPEDVLRFRCAVGHIESQKKPGTHHVTRFPFLSFGQKAAGATPSMTARDLLKFAAMHMNKGVAPDGRRVLKAASVRAMQKRQIALPTLGRSGVTHWGLGWFLMDWKGHKLYGHDGATMGQTAYLRILPEKDMAAVIFTNGGDMRSLVEDMFEAVFEPVIGASEPRLEAPKDEQPTTVSPYCGVYANMRQKVEVTESRGKLYAHTFDLEAGKHTTKKKMPLAFIGPDTTRYVTGKPMIDRSTFHFTRKDEAGRPHFLQTGFRQFRRQPDGA